MPDPTVTDLFRSLVRAFGERGLRWYVFGAQAVVAHGRPRLTADVDATVERGDMTPAEIAALLGQNDFELRFPLSEERAETGRLLPMVHTPSAIPLDLVIAGSGLDDEFLDRARVVDVGGVEVPVISPEDLLAMKVLAGRPKDLADIRGVLLEQRGKLDLQRTRDVLAAFEEATEERTLLASFDRLLDEASNPLP